MWYNAENNAIGGEKQNKKNKAENIPVLNGRLVYNFIVGAQPVSCLVTEPFCFTE